MSCIAKKRGGTRRHAPLAAGGALEAGSLHQGGLLLLHLLRCLHPVRDTRLLHDFHGLHGYHLQARSAVGNVSLRGTASAKCHVQRRLATTLRVPAM